MQVTYPPPFREIAVEDVYRELLFPSPPPDRPYVLLNFVTTIDGQASLGEGGVAGLGSKTDHRLMRRLRMVADGLLHGAGTVRRDNFPPIVPPNLEGERIARGLSMQPLGAVVTASGNLAPESRYFSRGRVVVFTTLEHVQPTKERLDNHAWVIGSGSGQVDLGQALGILRQRFGIRVLLSEGGPRLAHSLIAAGLLDELFLTVAPKLGSDHKAVRLLDGPAFAPDALPTAELVHILKEGSELFLRYRLHSGPQPD